MNENGFTIRAATSQDADALLVLIVALNDHLEEGEMAPLDAQTLTRDLLHAGSGYRVAVAERAGALIGFVLWHETWDSAHAGKGLYIAELYVAEAARRQGVARALVAEVAAEARARNYAFVWWLSEAWDTQAQAFYVALGAKHDPLVGHALDADALASLAGEGPRSER
ncbi:MAG: GNAT family N-acetyltransferase [Hyphomicrobiales bacterium]|nr:GNAT family N-acetyltransferase [Hyphomicrobiales bacterium]